MAQKKHTPEQIIRKLREVEVAQGKGKTTPQAVKQNGVSEQTFYRWRKEYGGMRVDQAKQLKELEKENLRLKRLVADLSLDNQILKEVTEGNFLARRNDDELSSMFARSWDRKWCRSAGLAGCWVRHVPPSVVSRRLQRTKMSWWHG